MCFELWVGWDGCGEVGCGAGEVGAGCELLGVGSVQGDEGAGCAEGARAGAEAEEGAAEGAEEGTGEEEELGERVSRPGLNWVGVCDRDEFRPANTC